MRRLQLLDRHIPELNQAGGRREFAGLWVFAAVMLEADFPLRVDAGKQAPLRLWGIGWRQEALEFLKDKAVVEETDPEPEKCDVHGD